MSRPLTTVPGVEMVIEPEALSTVPAGTPVLVAPGHAVEDDVVVGDGAVVVDVVVVGGFVVVVLDEVVVVLDGVVEVLLGVEDVVDLGLGVQVRLGWGLRGEPMAATCCAEASDSWRADSARWSPTVAAPTATAPTARAVAPVSSRRRCDVVVRTPGRGMRICRVIRWGALRFGSVSPPRGQGWSQLLEGSDYQHRPCAYAARSRTLSAIRRRS
jgi:hypothetical protein